MCDELILVLSRKVVETDLPSSSPDQLAAGVRQVRMKARGSAYWVLATFSSSGFWAGASAVTSGSSWFVGTPSYATVDFIAGSGGIWYLPLGPLAEPDGQLAIPAGLVGLAGSATSVQTVDGEARVIDATTPDPSGFFAMRAPPTSGQTIFADEQGVLMAQAYASGSSGDDPADWVEMATSAADRRRAVRYVTTFLADGAIAMGPVFAGSDAQQVVLALERAVVPGSWQIEKIPKTAVVDTSGKPRFSMRFVITDGTRRGYLDIRLEREAQGLSVRFMNFLSAAWLRSVRSDV